MQDMRYKGNVFFDVESLFLPKDNVACNYHKLPQLTTRQVDISQYSFFSDVMDQQMYIVSDAMNDLLALFIPDIDYRVFCLLDHGNKIFKYYYAYLFNSLDCFSEKSEANRDRSRISNLVLRKDTIQGRDVFKVGGVNCHVVVVSLPVAEAVLRRNFKGFQLVKVEIE